MFGHCAAIAGLCTLLVNAKTDFSTSSWQGTFSGGSGVLQSLRPSSNSSFDFSPSDYFAKRNGTGNYHTGDITLRWRVQGQAEWHKVNTAAARPANPVSSKNINGSLLHSNFGGVFPAASQHLNITRDWKADSNGNLLLQATVENNGQKTIELGAFGFPLEFNNIFTNRSATKANEKCVLVDPYIGLDAGYVQVTRLTGTGPDLVITPVGNVSKLEAWRFLSEPDGACDYRSQVYEGNYAWQTLSLAYVENEWNSTTPWNEGTSMFLMPGQSASFGLTFTAAPSVSEIESTVVSAGLPVAVGIPGYVLPTDMDGKLFLQSGSKVQSIDVDPSGMLDLTPSSARSPAWQAYDVVSQGYGRARVTITYADGRRQTVHYFIVKPTTDTANALGDFMFDKQWFTNASDPFHRAPSIIAYDYEVGQQILQEKRVWIAGLSDEGGTSYEAAALKTAVHPQADEVYKLEQMANNVIWGWLQNRNSSSGEPKFGVKRSLFFYKPKLVPGYTYDSSIDWSTWESWNEFDAYSVWRAYDYVHASAVYWGLYSAEQANPGILKMRKSKWYLDKAFQTVMASQAKYPNGTHIAAYSDLGLMGETVWSKILEALKAEGMNRQASKLTAAMKVRLNRWARRANPFGSEMAWDSTGQEGVYIWARYFNDTATMAKTLDSIRGYMPTVAHWGYNGNARRYWDFLYGGKIVQIERMIHHYGSSLNALPMLNAYEYNPDPSSISAIYDLRIGYGGNMGPLSNINDEGCPSTAFHSNPDLMKWDAYTGDYGPNFNGHILGSTTYIVEHPDFGWISFGGNLQQHGTTITVQPKDTVRRRVYVAALGLVFELNAGEITQVTYDTQSKQVTVKLGSTDDSDVTSARLVYKDTLESGVRHTTSGLTTSNGGYRVPIPGTITFGVGR